MAADEKALSGRMRRWLVEHFELSRGAAANLSAMEGLRGLAVFLVFLVHYATFAQSWIRGDGALAAFVVGVHSVGNAGVDLFFVLSGYLIYGSLMQRAQPFLRFMRRRIERIYPAFLAVLALYVALSLIFPERSKLPAEPMAAALYIAGNVLLLPGVFALEPIITVAWSLSYEMFFYLFIPLLIAMLALRRRSAPWRVALIGAAAVALAVYCAIYGSHQSFLFFIAGMLLHETLATNRIATPGSALGATALALAMGVMLLPLAGSAGYTTQMLLLAGAFYILCFACFARTSGALARAFAWTPLRWLGNMSYSYYLLHGLALNFAALVLAPRLSADAGAVVFWALLPVLFALTLLPSAVLFLAIERPFSLAPKGHAVPHGAPPLAAGARSAR
jgi:peptidoglycan/LPS O-acetylase OafA/YrhL